MFNENLSKLLGIPNRLPEEPINDIHKNMSDQIQYTYENFFFRLLNQLYEKTKSINLCLVVGAPYNGTSNGKIRENKIQKCMDSTITIWCITIIGLCILLL